MNIIILGLVNKATKERYKLVDKSESFTKITYFYVIDDSNGDDDFRRSMINQTRIINNTKGVYGVRDCHYITTVVSKIIYDSEDKSISFYNNSRCVGKYDGFDDFIGDYKK